MLWLRSLAFNIIFYVNLILFLVLGFWCFFIPRKKAIRALQLWATTSLWWLKVLTGLKFEVCGQEHIPKGPAIVAGKHQSTWETFAVLPLVDDPAMILKRELTYIPLFGWFIFKFKMIPVERSAGASAMKKMIAAAKQAISDGRQILVFPEGTRRPPGAPPDYKPGAAALYLNLKVACVPMALNSGIFWPRRKFVKYPGTIVVEFLPPIPPGLSRKDFQSRLESLIETATERLVAEARSNLRTTSL
jgi:1-acyl-sn-glycerol-3-phosphate acyltransferase